ncbi:MAG: carotenoid oxygenase family protein [Bradyrhizobium icense]|jgi:carotenoid cleavage dioxygenase-like enzyme|nr:MAG: carotenoid oxygenase family protein [Bradyrhizobium icense]
MTSAARPNDPFWMKGTLAPVSEEVMTFDLDVEGEIPQSLNGLYARNGANPRRGHSGHWFLGDGMVHGVSIRDGRAEWYRNRWVRTPRFAGEPRTPDTHSDLHFSLANTNVMAHAGHIFALVENALPVELDRELNTIGPYDFDGALATPFTAHPKVCAVSGELHFFGYRVQPPYLTYHVAHRSGRILRSLEIPVKAPTMVHDMALTAGHVIFLDLPVVFDLKIAQQGTMPFSWSDTYGARLGILPRGAPISALRWVEIDPCYVYHVANAFETPSGEIVIDVAWYAEHWRDGPSPVLFDSARMKRWRIAPGAGKAKEEFLDDRTVEFPKIDDRRSGREHRNIYAVATDNNMAGGAYHALIQYDVVSGRSVVHDFGSGVPSEFSIAAAAGQGDDEDGFALGFVFDPKRNASDLVILNGHDISQSPLARIKLPRRVPQGFHGNWMPDV